MLFGNSIDGFVEVRAIPTISGKRILRKWYDNHDDLFHDLLWNWGKLNGEKYKFNLYFGVCPRHRKGGKKQDVNHIRCLWVDLDVKNYPSEYAASNTVLDFSPSVDLMVKSGTGFHCYWMLDKAIKISDIHARIKAEASIKGLHNRLGCGGDGTHDLSRVLRVPGTLNWKYDPPVDCEVYHVRN
jgi:hypothetical protein